MSDRGLIAYQRYGRIALTSEGERQAHSVIRRHRLAERLLTDVLGVPLDQVHEEACRLEHALSPDVEDRIAETLGDPQACPHGNPIDTQSDAEAGRLSEATEGEMVVVASFEDESPEVVRDLTARGLLPPARVNVVAREPRSDGVVIEVNGVRQTLGRDFAAAIRVVTAERAKQR